MEEENKVTPPQDGGQTAEKKYEPTEAEKKATEFVIVAERHYESNSRFLKRAPILFLLIPLIFIIFGVVAYFKLQGAFDDALEDFEEFLKYPTYQSQVETMIICTQALGSFFAAAFAAVPLIYLLVHRKKAIPLNPDKKAIFGTERFRQLAATNKKKASIEADLYLECTDKKFFIMNATGFILLGADFVALINVLCVALLNSLDAYVKARLSDSSTGDALDVMTMTIGLIAFVAVLICVTVPAMKAAKKTNTLIQDAQLGKI